MLLNRGAYGLGNAAIPADAIRQRDNALIRDRDGATILLRS